MHHLVVTLIRLLLHLHSIRLVLLRQRILLGLGLDFPVHYHPFVRRLIGRVFVFPNRLVQYFL
jgi:hypothetical protein